MASLRQIYNRLRSVHQLPQSDRALQYLQALLGIHRLGVQMICVVSIYNHNVDLKYFVAIEVKGRYDIDKELRKAGYVYDFMKIVEVLEV